MAGKFIVLEGGEGAGKSTQLQMLFAWLQNAGVVRELFNRGFISDIVLTREPGGTPLGYEIRHLLLDCEATLDERHNAEPIAPHTELLLYAADRTQHVHHFLNPHLKNNALVLCDRYTDSTVAYQGYGRGLDLEMIDTLNTIATGGLQSDLTLWLDIDVDAGLARTRQRGKADRIELNHHTFHKNVRRGFQTLAQEHPDRIVRIDASQDVERVAWDIQRVMSVKLEEWYGRW